MAESSYYPIYAKESKDVPEWMRRNHDWQAAVAVDKLPKYQLKVKLCCLKCEEKVIEEIREVHGVFDVRAERLQSKVVVVASTPSGLDEHEVLRKARKINRKAKFVELDAKEKPKKGDDDKKKEEEKKKKEKEEEKKKKEKEEEKKKKGKEEEKKKKGKEEEKKKKEKEEEKKKKEKEEEKKKKGKEEEKKKKEKEEEKKIHKFKPLMHWGASPYYTPSPVAYVPGEYRPGQHYPPRYHYPPLPSQPEDGYFRQYVYHY